MQDKPLSTLTLKAFLGFGLLAIATSLSAIATVEVLWHFPQGWRVFFFDLEIYRNAGTYVLENKDFYDPEFGRAFFGHPIAFSYTPFAALLFVPLAVIPIWLCNALGATLLWAIPVIFITATIYKDQFIASKNRTGIILALALLAGLSNTALDVLGYGQIGLLVVAAVVFDSLAPTQWWKRLPRGVLTGVAAAVKLTPAVFIGYWFITGQWRKAFTAVSTVIVAWTLALIVLPERTADFFFHGGLTQLTVYLQDRVAHGANQSVAAAVMRATDTWPLPNFVWMTLAISFVSVGLAAARFLHDRSRELDAVTVLGLAICLGSPVSWVHHFGWLLLVPAVLLDGKPIDFARLTGRVWMWLLLWFALVIPGPQYTFEVTQTPLVADAYIILSMAIVIGVMVRVIKEGSLSEARVDL